MDKAINGFKAKNNYIEALGGGFRFCSISHRLFNSAGNINEEVHFFDLASFVFFCETGTPWKKDSKFKVPLIGLHNNEAVYLLYNGILGDKTPKGGNALTRSVIAGLPPHNGPKVIYGTSCRIGEDRLAKENISFKQIPYAIKVE